MNTQAIRSRCRDDRNFHNGAPWKCTERNWRIRDHVISTAKDFDVAFSSALEKAAGHFHCIAIDSDTLGGTPRIAGTRIPVYMILDAIEHYGDLAGAIKSYPRLSLGQVKEAVSFAAEVLEHPVDYKTEPLA